MMGERGTQRKTQMRYKFEFSKAVENSAFCLKITMLQNSKWCRLLRMPGKNHSMRDINFLICSCFCCPAEEDADLQWNT
jgi:hypothetical protein